MFVKSILDCIFGTQVVQPHPTTDSRSPESIASDIVTIVLNADTPYSLHKQLNDEVSVNNWSHALANAILRGLVNAINTGAQMARAAADALAQSTNAAFEFARDHPVYTTLLALGVLAILMPWALEALGFGELGPIEGSFAAAWQRLYSGYVPKKPLFSYFQRLGMKWHWTI